MTDLPPRPRLVVVGGIPGSGKSTLAHEIGRALHLPVVIRDAIKTGMHVTHGSADPAEQHRFASAAFDAAFAVTQALLDAGSSAVLEAAFHRDHSGPPLRALAGAADAHWIWSACPPDVALERYRARSERGERHPAHNDPAVIGRMEAGELDWSIYDPPPGIGPIVRVDTVAPLVTLPRDLLERLTQ